MRYGVKSGMKRAWAAWFSSTMSRPARPTMNRLLGVLGVSGRSQNFFWKQATKLARPRHAALVERQNIALISKLGTTVVTDMKCFEELQRSPNKSVSSGLLP